MVSMFVAKVNFQSFCYYRKKRLYLHWGTITTRQSPEPLAFSPPSTCFQKVEEIKNSWVGEAQGGGIYICAKSLQLCPTLRNLMDCSQLDFSVHGILQARILEWVAMPSSRGSSQLRDQTYVSYVSCIGRWVLYHQHHLGNPWGDNYDWFSLMYGRDCHNVVKAIILQFKKSWTNKKKQKS